MPYEYICLILSIDNSARYMCRPTLVNAVCNSKFRRQMNIKGSGLWPKSNKTIFFQNISFLVAKNLDIVDTSIQADLSMVLFVCFNF